LEFFSYDFAALKVEKETRYALNCVILGVLMLGEETLIKCGFKAEKSKNLGEKKPQYRTYKALVT